jgi:adenosylcobinamide kinase/adenosylcobinamide-phosphate guanylyltransferase
LAARVRAHQARRPSWWQTAEVGEDLPAVIRALEGTLLVDSLGAWVAALPAFAANGAGLCAALLDRPGDAVVVSDEVGLGVHPSTDVGRRFRDALGDINQAVAAIADEVMLVVAGRVLPLEHL